MAKRIPSAGFTLVEVLVVISVIAILAGIGLMGYKSIRKTMDEKIVRSEVDQLRKAILDYRALNKVVITRGKDKDNVAWFDGYPAQSAPTNAKMIEALSSPNSTGAVAYDNLKLQRLSASGELSDKWGTPYVFKVVFKRGKGGVPLIIQGKTFAEVSDVGVFSAGYDQQQTVADLGNWEEGVDLTMHLDLELLSPPNVDLDNIYPSN